MPAKNTSYDKPQLRQKLKKKVEAEGRGGKPGQWSARKAQLLAQEYKKAGGGYKKAASGGQKSLKRWTQQEWTTEDGGKSLRSGGAKRYLPKSAWKKLSGPQKAKANASKQAGDAKGKQFVANPKAAKSARKKATRTGVGKKKTKKTTARKAGKKKATARKTGKKKTTARKTGKKKATARKTGKKKATARKTKTAR